MGINEEPTEATARITGVITEKCHCVWVPLDKQNVARGTIGFFPVVAYGKVAEDLVKLPLGTHLNVNATLTMHKWKTREGKNRSQMELAITSLAVIEKPKLTRVA